MLPLAAAHAQPATSWEDTIKESIDATQHRDMPAAPDGTLVPSDLSLDPGFLPWVIYSPPIVGATDIEDGLRTFPYTTCTAPPIILCSHSGYYIAGRKKNDDGTWRSSITRRKSDGQPDPSFGSGGWQYPSTAALAVADAAIGAGRIYILSTVDLGGVPVMRATCTDLTSGGSCFAGFGGIITFGATSSGAIRSAWAQRIIYDSRYGVFIAGRIYTVARGWEIAIARLDPDTGALNTEFRGDGTNTGLPGWAAQTDSSIEVYDMAVVPNGTPGGERLYVAGTLKIDATDSDGFVVGMSPTTGATSTGWGWNNYYYESDNSGYKKDAITAITVLRNGRLAMAGWSETDIASERVMFLARAKADGSQDTAFCADGSNFGICRSPVRALIGVTNDDFPVAIAERAGNRDLVIALKTKSRTGDYHPVQAVHQLNSRGTQVHASQTMEWGAASGTTQWARPFGMWVGNIGSLLLQTTNEVVTVVGTRKFNATDCDATLTQLIANDSIYADQFGGSHGD